MSEPVCGHQPYPGDERHCSAPCCANQSVQIQLREFMELKQRAAAAEARCERLEDACKTVITQLIASLRNLAAAKSKEDVK